MPKNRHERKLVPSSADVVCMSYEVEHRFLQICQDHVRIRHEELPIPEEIGKDLYRWREMRVRHACLRCKCKTLLEKIEGGYAFNPTTKMPVCAKCAFHGDYRHRADELKSLKVIAKWLLTVNAKLRNQPVPEFEWSLS